VKNISKLLVATLVLGTAFSPLTAMAATPTVSANTVATTTTSVTPAAYADLNKASTWAQQAILQAKQLGLMAGDPDGNFRPQDKMTRQEFAAILSRLLELVDEENSAPTTSTFADVPSTAWGLKYIEAVKAAGIMVGDGNGTFRPNALISREELAVTLVKAAEGQADGKGANLSVADKDSVSTWAKDYVQAAIEMGLMRGDGERFSPKQNTTREQAAVVAINFVDYKHKPAVIESAAEGTVTIKGTTYTVADSLKGLFTADNSAILKDAKIKFDAEGDTLTGITSLEIVKGGQAAEAGKPEFSGNLTLDGGNAVLAGDLKISANYVTVNNLTVEGNLEIAQGLQNDFSSDKLTVNGKTLINGGDTNTVVFTNANLRDVEINKADVRVEYKEKSVVGDVVLNANASIVADSSITLPKISVKENVNNVEIDATVTALEVKNTNSKLDLKTNAKIDNLVLPTGTKVEDVVKNFEQNKGKFANVNGAKNPDAPGQGGTIPGTGGTTPNNGGTTPGGTTPPGQGGTNPGNGGTTPPSTEPFNVQLLSINDLHGKIDQVYEENISGDSAKEKIGGMDYLAAYLKQREATNPNTLIVHAGDAVGGSSPVSSLFKEEPTVELMNYIGFDMGTIGNHELDKGTAEMLRLTKGGATADQNATEGYEGIKFPMIAANMVYKSDGKLVLPAYETKTVNGVKVGFVGVVTQGAAGMVMPAGIQDIEFTDETIAVNNAVADLKAQGVEAIIVLAHMDATQSGTTITGEAADLANTVDDEVDIIMAAHNHKLVNGTVDNKLIVQSYEYGKAFADVDFKIDPVTKDIIEKSAEIVYVDRANITPDAGATAILNKYAEAIKPIMDQKVGEATLEMVGGYSTLTDNALGNMIADSMRAAMNSDFAMMNGGGIRSNINAGDITWGELYNILPFNNVLVKVEIKGADLFPILEAQLGRQYGGDYSVSGLKFTWNTSTLKVESVTLPDGTPVDPTKTYTLTVNNFMQTSTSSKYRPIGTLGKNPVSGPEDLEALVNFVKNYQGPLAYEADGRIAINDFAIARNNAGATDTLFVNGLTAGNVVKVYASPTSTTPLAQATVGADAHAATVTGLDFGVNGGQIYFTVSSMAFGKLTEGPRIPKTVGIELPVSEAVTADQITVTNNAAGTPDVIEITGLQVGDVVKVYDAAVGGTRLAWQEVLGDVTKINIDQLGTQAGTVYVTVTRADKLESERTAKAFAQEATPSSTINLQLLSMNDLHGKIDQQYALGTKTVGRIDYVAAHMKQREATNPNTLIVHAGDMVGGSSPVSALFQDEPTVEIMEAMGFDVGTIGNHELDEGTVEMMRLINGGDHAKGTKNYDGINFPMVASNLYYKGTNERVLPAYVIKEVEGVKVAFIGVMTTDALNMVVPAGIQDVYTTDEATEVNKVVAELKQQGIESIIILSHMSASQSGTGATDEAADLANTVDDEVDVIFAAHNHQKVDAIVDNKLIVQAQDYGKAFADVDLVIDRATGDIISKEAQIVDVVQEGITPDPTVAGILSKYQDLVAPTLNEVVGQAPTAISGKNGDAPLGNLLAESMKVAAGSDFAAINAGGVRATLDAGPITYNDLFNILPFNNVLTTVEVTGAEMETILNAQIVDGTPDFSIAGFRYTHDGTKVIDIFLPDGTTKIDKTKTYTFTVNNYMATSTGSKYINIFNLGKNPVTGIEDLPALIDYVKSFGSTPVTSTADGRVKKVTVAPTDLGAVSIAELRAAGTGKIATITGVVTSTPGAWGGKAFYVHDASGGLYVYTTTDLGVALGDQVTVTGTTAAFSGELQLQTPTLKSKAPASALPAPTVVTPAAVTAATQGQLFRLEGVTVSGITLKNSFGTFEFTATKGTESAKVYVDNRVGLTHDQFISQFAEGSVVNVTGVNGTYSNAIVLKATKASDIQAVVTDEQAVSMDKNALAIGFGTNDTATGVTQNVTLPTSGNNGTTISWASSDEAVIAKDGTVTRPAAGASNATVTLTATIQRNGVQDTRTFDVIVLAPNLVNQAPTVVNPIANQTKKVGVVSSFYLSNMFADADGDALTLSAVSSDSNIVVANWDGTMLSIRPVAAGIATITITADDGNGHVVPSTFTVTVEKTHLTVAEAKLLSATNGGVDNPVVTIRGYLTSTTAKNGTNAIFVIADEKGITDFNDAKAIQIPQSTTGLPADLKNLLLATPIGSYVEIVGTRDVYGSGFPASMEKVTVVKVLQVGVTNNATVTVVPGKENVVYNVDATNKKITTSSYANVAALKSAIQVDGGEGTFKVYTDNTKTVEAADTALVTSTMVVEAATKDGLTTVVYTIEPQML